MLSHVVFGIWATAWSLWVASESKGALAGRASPLLSVVVLIVLVAEPWLLRRRFVVLSARLASTGQVKWGERPELPGAVWLAIAHLLLGPVMVMVAGAAVFGSAMHWATLVFVVLCVAREVYVFGLLMSPPVAEQTSATRHHALVDVGLQLVSTVGFSATWLPIASRGEPINQVGVGGTLLYGTIAGLLFLAFYLPSRVGFVLEEWSAADGARTWVRRGALAFAIVSALRPLVVIEDGRWFMTEARAHQLARERR